MPRASKLTRALAGAGLIASAASCGGERPEAPPAPAAPAPVRHTAPAVTGVERSPPEFCPVLARILAREDEGYAGLRAAPIGRERWQAKAALPGIERCVIEGEAWPRARLTCSSSRAAGTERELVLARFEVVADQIDHCLGRGFWFPRNWERGQLFEFAMDERQLTWVDTSSLPPSAVVLKVQQELASRDYRLQVDLQTIRR